MEILNNIWNTLCTPNIFLLNIISIPLILIEVTLNMFLFLSIMNFTSTKKQKFIYILLNWLVGILTMFIIPRPYNIFVNYFFIILLQYLVFSKPFFKSIFSSVTTLVIYNLIGLLISKPFLLVFQIESSQLNSILLYKLSYLLIVYALNLLCIFIFKNIDTKFNFPDYINNENKSNIIITLCFGILTIIIQSITLFYYVDNLPIYITFLNFLIALIYFIISIYSLNKSFKLISTTQKLETVNEYNKSLSILKDNIRCFKHDFDNIVTTIGGYIRTNDMEGLKEYYLQLEDDCQRVNNLFLLTPNIINNDGIYNLLTKKYEEAESKGIKFNMTFLLDLTTLRMKIYEFARILGILLDNAIEASSETDEKIINLIFKNDAENNRQLIIIENTYKDKNINTEKIFEKGVSSKENHTGIGLWEVRKLISKNNNVNLHTTVTEKYFSQQLEIY